jgi:hypothetical protein
MRYFLLIGLLFSFSQQCFSQGEYPGELTDDFIFSVQTIDDFFDRFNFTPSTPIFQYVQLNYPDAGLDRNKIILSLFENKITTWNPEDVKSFVEHFGAPKASLLRFEQPNWYAVLHCKVVYQRKRRNLDLIMRAEAIITKAGKIGFKWSVIAVKAPFIRHPEHPEITSERATKQDTLRKRKWTGDDGKFLHPMSHALNFMNVYDIFDKNTTRDYFARNAKSGDLDTLVSWINSSRIRFIQVDSVTYQLLQLPGWIVSVSYFDRQGHNSGWLISKLIPADDNKKRSYLVNQLNIQ